jgi:hypothetical protein
MGGTGNTGQTGELTSGPTMAMGGGTGGTITPPAAVTTPDWVAPPPEARPYEAQTASTGALGTPAATASGPGPVTEPATQNLGFPTGFNHDPYPTAAATVPTVASQAPVVAPTTTPETPVDPNAPRPDDWLYPGNLPMNFDSRVPIDPSAKPQAGGNFGMPWAYSATGPNQTAGYGAVGNFGGVTGRGPQQIGLKPQVLMPQMAAGTKLKDAEIDQYNRVSRADYDRYMRLYGVGYDLPAYQQALNGLVYQQNMQNYGGTGGG